ncbi:hypothetical protein NPIL_125481 [Nephila pilipes]|uniref:Uncharacterized protein n=1 Tax=Nephila pilipes TaxID=299642 RepID=A0A8X6MVB5_NEPPI|nr:hypothetical protein NPIL_125481 [Nephila pilipes]
MFGRRELSVGRIISSELYKKFRFFSLTLSIKIYKENKMATLHFHRMLLLSLIGTIFINQSSSFPTETPATYRDVSAKKNSMLQSISNVTDIIAYRFAYHSHEEDRPSRKFHEVDSKGFDGDIFDEGFGQWSPMKRF